MDGVEIARSVAADLHRQAVENGDDPWRPYEFAIAEAKRRDIDVEKIAPGAAMLNGGRATYIADDALILHENRGTPFDQAFLIAHEIGHVELGDDRDRTADEDIDQTRTAEASPIGVDRVVDYGRRQRREIQMDLFAREFLLPRPVVRKLHVEDGLTASQIADRLGAPFDVVAQQLLDALLLPPIAPMIDAEWTERPLNPLQAAAAKHRGRAYLLEAGPGTGKTQTLTARVASLIEQGVDPRRILLLTFSNKAAGEMAERIARKNKEAAAAMWIGTFHAFGLDLIRRFHAELDLPKDPRMMDRTEAAELLESEFPRLDLVHYRNLYDPTQIISDILTAISRAKDEVVDDEQYALLAEAMLQRPGDADDRISAAKALEVAKIYEAYEKLKRQANCIDFGDLVSMPVSLLEGNAEIRAHLQGLYDHVLVDEYQDVNRSSIRLLAALRGAGHNLWAVGDAKQSIYRFRGASSFNMARFGKEDFPGGERGRLKVNYRSVDEVVKAFSAFAVGMKAADADSELTSDRGAGGMPPELRKVDRSDDQTVAIAETIAEMRLGGHPYRDQAVLCTGNERLSELGQNLERLGIPVLFLGSLFDRPEVKDLIAFLSLLADRRATGLVRVACWAEFAMPIADVAAVFDHLRADSIAPVAWLQNVRSIPSLSAQGEKALAGLALALREFDQAARPWRVLATLLLDHTRMAVQIADAADVANRARGIAIWQLMNFLRTQPSGQGLPISRLLDRIRRLVRLGDDRDLRQLPAAAQGIDAVRLMTIHGAKGLEFPVVHIPGMNANTLPRTPATPACLPPDSMVEGGSGKAIDVFRSGHAEEQECLFYVALSRARDRLFLYAPTRNASGAKRPLSPFLDRLGSGLASRNIAPTGQLPPAPDASDVSIIVEGRQNFTGPQIALYEACPRRFFYTHIMQTGGRRTTTSYMRMHEAVRTVINVLIAERDAAVDHDALKNRIDAAFIEQGLIEHGYAHEYKGFAFAMVDYFVSIRAGHRPEPTEVLSVNFGDADITILPDDVLVKPDGGRTLRRIQTGHARSREGKDVGAAAFKLAVGQKYPTAAAEIIHLSDQTAQPLALSDKELENRREKLATFLNDIGQGRFPANSSERTCPRCPAYFICGPTPAGALTKKF
jgi:superfamily I DNA/RNA helicase